MFQILFKQYYTNLSTKEFVIILSLHLFSHNTFQMHFIRLRKQIINTSIITEYNCTTFIIKYSIVCNVYYIINMFQEFTWPLFLVVNMYLFFPFSYCVTVDFVQVLFFLNYLLFFLKIYLLFFKFF